MKIQMLLMIPLVGMIIKLTQQACTSTQYLDSSTSTCVSWVNPWKSCTSSTAWTACAHAEMVLSGTSEYLKLL